MDDLLSFAGAVETRHGFAFPKTCEEAERWLAAWAALPRIGSEVSPDRLRTALLAPVEVRQLSELLRTYRSTFSSIMADLEHGAATAEHLERTLRELSPCADAQLWEPHGAQALKLHASRLAEAGLFDRLFRKTYKTSHEVAQSIALDRSLDRLALAELMRQLSAWQEGAAAFGNDPRMRWLFGERWAVPGIRGVHNAHRLIEQARGFLRSSDMGGLQALLRAAGSREETTDAALEQLLRLHSGLSVPPDESALWFWYGEPDEDPEALERALAAAAAIDACGLAGDVRATLGATDDARPAIADLLKRAEEGRVLIGALRGAWHLFCASVKAEPASFLGGPGLESTEWRQMSDRLRLASEDEAGMRLYAELLKYLRTAQEAGVRFVFDAFAEEGRTIKSLADAYELLVVQGLLKQFLDNDGQFVQTIGGATLTRARESFRALDEELYRLEAERIVAKRLNDTVPHGIGHGPAGQWTDHALIRRELRRRNHIPVRQLVARASGALQTMKPVWLMSPLSVAQYIAPGTASFDLVIIDEASQMKPEFAVGSIARATQVVVVGDPKQLPPADSSRRRGLIKLTKIRRKKKTTPISSRS